MNTPIGPGLGEVLGEALITPALPEGRPEPQLKHPQGHRHKQARSWEQSAHEEETHVLLVIEHRSSLNPDPVIKIRLTRPCTPP
jgi:hypothetical protein